ncbi:MAG: HAMP domain-containing protein, partial [Limisphaerales bacterium]
MKLNSKVAFSMLLVALLPLAAFGWAALKLAQKNLTNQVKDHLQLTAALSMQRVQQLAIGYEEKLRLCSSRTQLRLSLREFVLGGATNEQARMNKILRDVLPEIESFETISVTDLQGIVVASTDGNFIGHDFSSSLVLLNDRTNAVVDDFFVHEGMVKLRLSGPLSIDGEHLGNMVIRSTADDLFSVLAQRSGLLHTGEILLAERTSNGDARFISPMQHAPNTELRRIVSKDDQHIPITQAMLKIRRSMDDLADYRGVPVLAATDYINSPDWGLVVKIDKAEALEPLDTLARSYYAALATTAGVVLIFGLAASRFLTRPIIRLSESAQRVQRGDFTHRAEEHRPDELGQLAHSFNAMSHELIQLNENLEGRVKQRTEELEESNHTLRRTQEKLERFNHELEDLVKERATELKSSEERFHLVAQGAVGGIWDWSVPTGDCNFSDLWLEQVGYMRDELPAKQESWIGLLHPDDKSTVAEHLQKHLDEHAPCDLECRLRIHNGDYRWFRCCGQAQWNAEGQAIRMVGSHTDITEQKRNQNAVLESQKLESLGILAGGIAHDFNNILTAIVGNISLAKNEISPTSPLEPVLADVENAAMRAAELCNQMLAYSGQGRFEVMDLNLSELIRDMENLLQVSVSKTAVLKFELRDELPAAPVDASQIRQVIMNLVINASEAIGERSGIINVANGLARLDTDYLTTTHLAPDLPPGDYVFIEVNDSGCGMD